MTHQTVRLVSGSKQIHLFEFYLNPIRALPRAPNSFNWASAESASFLGFQFGLANAQRQTFFLKKMKAE